MVQRRLIFRETRYRPDTVLPPRPSQTVANPTCFTKIKITIQILMWYKEEPRSRNSNGCPGDTDTEIVGHTLGLV